MKRHLILGYLTIYTLLVILVSCQSSSQESTNQSKSTALVNSYDNLVITETNQSNVSSQVMGICKNQQIFDDNFSVQLDGRILVYLANDPLIYKTIENDWSIENLDIKNAYDLFSSPDGQWLSYWKQDNEEHPYQRTSIEFVSGTDDQRISLPWDDDFKLPKGSPWFGFEYIRYIANVPNQYPQESLITPQNKITTLSWQELPDIYLSEGQTSTWVNPSLTYVLYATKPKVEGENVIQTYRLWDVKNESIIWESPYDYIINSDNIVWSYDGTLTALTGRYRHETTPDFQMYELYTLSINGDLVQKTFFNDEFSRFSIGGLVWAPDNNKLLFRFADESSMNPDIIATYPEPNPLVLDILSGDIIDYCLSGAEAIQPWSPNSSQLALISNINDIKRLVIVDIESGSVLIAPFDICVASECEYSDEFGLTQILGWLK